ncbi:hypothetical protein ACGFJT_42020 [Actinomadura geliboluensis]|uniref:hypothetical protein n=1 Tax=Actinomadura geliboluensis TaxID=882440 RepID=UPI0037131C09
MTRQFPRPGANPGLPAPPASATPDPPAPPLCAAVRAIHDVIGSAVSDADAATLRTVIAAVLGMCVSEREAAEQARRTAAGCAGDTLRRAVLEGQAYGRNTAAARIEDEIILALDLEDRCDAATAGLPDDEPSYLPTVLSTVDRNTTSSEERR